MSRIAEFEDLDDANRFRRLKGPSEYEVVAGINYPWAVMPRIRYATNLGNPESPPESHVDFDYGDDDE